jgi:hypothetical protein
MLTAGKQVFMYFSDKPISPSQMDSDGYKKVQAFREKYKDKGIYYSYDTDKEFKSMIFAHISQYFLSEKRVAEINEERVPMLKIVGINAQQCLSDYVDVLPFHSNMSVSIEQYKSKILDMYTEIEKIPIEGPNEIEKKQLELAKVMNPVRASFVKHVGVSDEDKKYLGKVADKLGIKLSDDFFDLGSLSQNMLNSNVLYKAPLDGTENEKIKYQYISELKDIISEFIKWTPIERAFSNQRCIKLALQNRGTAVDEDIEITLKMPSASIFTIDDFPQMQIDDMEYLLDNDNMEKVFGIPTTSEFIDYFSSQPKRQFINSSRSSLNMLYGRNYADDYYHELKNLFCYSTYQNNEDIIVKIKFAYIKHHTTIAFPTIIFIKDRIDNIEYEITSKNVADIITGKITINE